MVRSRRTRESLRANDPQRHATSEQGAAFCALRPLRGRREWGDCASALCRASMGQIVGRARYSYRDDPSVPEFDDSGPIAFMDGECTLCSTSACLIARLDRRNEFRICPVQSQLGKAVLTHYGLDPNDPDSWLYVVDGGAWTSIEAMIRVGRRLGGPGRIASVFSVIPRPLQDWIYRRIARNRYRILGRRRMCAIPDPALRSRLMQ